MQIRKLVLSLLFSVSVYAVSAQSVGLVLSGGGAKGLSHIGAIKALEENGIPIDYVAGTSMGAIVAGLYSIGLSPDEMMVLFRSKEFESWYKGQYEQGYATYIYRRESTPEMMGVSFSRGKGNKIQIDLPTSLVSPYPMDLAVMQLFASPAAACGYDFNKLMVPFRCVASDISNKKPFVARKGDLGSAIRASMTYPFYFKPIIIDSTLLFDGGFYNNFPWDVMEKDFNPDYIIGVKCANNAQLPDADDLMTQVENMLMVETNYNIPDHKGILVDGNYSTFGIMDFAKVEEIVEQGYQNALKYIPQIKKAIVRRVSAREISDKRLAFRMKCPKLRFVDVADSPNLSPTANSFIKRTITNDKDTIFDFEQVKRGYYRVIASDNVKTFYPQARMRVDSLFTLHLRTSKSSPMRLTFGGNVSSSSLNQGYVGLEYKRFATNPWRLALDLNIGRYYSGSNIYWRHDVGVKPLVFYEIQHTAHRFDYFGGSQTLFFSNRVPSNIQESEVYMTFSVGTPLSIQKSILAKASFNFGKNFYEYFKTNIYTTNDKPDLTSLLFASGSAYIEANTTNFKLYPTEGKNAKLSVRYTYFNEEHKPGTTSPQTEYVPSTPHHSVVARLYSESYHKINRWLNLGVLVDVTFSNKTDMYDYYSTLLFMQPFQPSPHSKTLLLAGYRSNSFAGFALTPIVKFSNNLHLHLQGAYFQPHTTLIDLGGGDYETSKPLPRGSLSMNFAAVWQSPIGPISLSASYYEKSDLKWYPQFNIGFLIFKSKALSN